MSAPTLDPYVFRHLVNQGVMTRDRVTRKPTPRACRDCHTPVIAVLTDETPTTRLDLTPHFLTPLGELQAALAGAPTFEWSDGVIFTRYPERVRGRPANTARALVAHSCNGPIFDHGPDPTPPKQRTPITDRIPF